VRKKNHKKKNQTIKEEVETKNMKNFVHAAMQVEAKIKSEMTDQP
jgi:hypothetical protein